MKTANDSEPIKPLNPNKTEGNGGDFEAPINPIIAREDFVSSPPNKENYSFQPETQNQTESIADRAKNFKPAIKTIVDLVDSAGVRALQSTARSKGWSDEDIETLEQRARMQGDTYDIIVNSGSRIAARYVKNDEWLDWAALTGGFVQWGVSLVIAIREIKKNAKEVEDDKTIAPESDNEEDANGN